jgi:hypothetical protein
MRVFLTCMSVFSAAGGIWLAGMENILKHAGRGQRSGVAACIAIQGLATVLFLVREGRSFFRALVPDRRCGRGAVGSCGRQANSRWRAF